jgi:hypothetical protein
MGRWAHSAIRGCRLPDTRRNVDEAGTGVDALSPPKPAGFTRRELDCRGRVIRSARMAAD